MIKNKKSIIENNSKPHITILIPAFNEENIISQTIYTTLSLDYKNYSILVVDDCSTDNTYSKLVEIQKNNADKLQIVKNSNRMGKSSIMNYFIPKIKSDFILILDANIFIDNNALCNLVKKIDEKTGIVYGNLIFDKNKYSSITDKEINYWNFETNSKILQEKHSNITSPVGGFYLLRKNCFVNIPQNCQIEDMFVLIEILKKDMHSHFSENSQGHELTVKSSFSEFKRKQRIISGGYFILFNQILSLKIFALSKSDLLALFFGKILRWIIPVLFLILIVFSIFNFEEKTSQLFLLFNIICVIAIFIEFTFNSLINIITKKNNVRVRLFNSFLYFYTIILAGICAIFYDNKDTLWVKEKR